MKGGGGGCVFCWDDINYLYLYVHVGVPPETSTGRKYQQKKEHSVLSDCSLETETLEVWGAFQDRNVLLQLGVLWGGVYVS